MDDLIKRQNNFTNVTEWHNAGYKGEGQVVWNMEEMTDHGQQTHDRVLHAAPCAEVHTNGLGTIYNHKEIIQDIVYADGDPTTEEFINRHNIGILTRSIAGTAGTVTAYSKHLETLRDKYKLVAFGAAGNKGESGAGSSLPDHLAVWVGACGWRNGDELYAHNYSGVGRPDHEDVDFCSFTGGFNMGTSLASPFLAGMAALVRQRLGDLTQAEIYTYFKTYAQPLPSGFYDHATGYDLKTGWGVAKLPPLSKKYISLTIDSKSYKVSGELKGLDTAPFIKDSRTFVPVAFVARELGAEVEWDGKLRLVHIRKDGKTIALGIDLKSYMVNGKTFAMDTAPFIKDSRTFVPVSFVANALDCVVEWTEKQRRVNILEQ